MSQGKEHGERVRERENLNQAPRSVQSLTQGSIPQPWNHDLNLIQDLDTQLGHLVAPAVPFNEYLW